MSVRLKDRYGAVWTYNRETATWSTEFEFEGEVTVSSDKLEHNAPFEVLDIAAYAAEFGIV